MQWTNYVGYVGALLTAVNFLPQVIKAYKTKDAEDISYWMLILVIASQVVWLIYSISLQLIPVIISNASLLLLALTLMILKYMYKRRKV